MDIYLSISYAHIVFSFLWIEKSNFLWNEKSRDFQSSGLWYLFPGKHDALFTLSFDSPDQSGDPFYWIIIWKYNYILCVNLAFSSLMEWLWARYGHFFMSLSLKCFFSRLFFNEIESVSQVKKNFTLQMLK